MAALTTIAAISAAAAVAGYQSYGQKRALDNQNRAQRSMRNAAVATQKAAEEATNRANQKRPNVASILAAAQEAAKGGLGSTMLTGPAGVPNEKLLLGRNTLLGS